MIGAVDNEGQDQRRRQGNGDVFRDAEYLGGAGDTGELGDCGGRVRHQEDEHRQGGDAHAEPFADKVGEPSAGDGAQSSGDLGYDRQGNHAEDDRP